MVKVGKIEGQDVEFDQETFEFSVEIEGKKFKAKSFPGLQRAVTMSKEVKWEKAIQVAYDESRPPEVISVTLRGKTYYEVVDGKMHSIGSWNLYVLDEAKLKKMTEISNRIQKLKEQWNKIKNKLKRLS